jgi:hypothetical protein
VIVISIKRTILFISLALLSFGSALANQATKSPALYIGVIGGYGSTTWDGLVPSSQNQNIAMSMSTPIKVEEGGAVWGALIGYELSPYFALEVNYLKYADAQVSFDPQSLFAFNNNDLISFTTQTESVSLMGKIMLDIPHTRMKAYSSAGVAKLHRDDMVVDEWRITPTFGVGLMYPMTQHLMGELAGNYTAGFGESQLNPVDTYYPFLYSVTARLAYRF